MCLHSDLGSFEYAACRVRPNLGSGSTLIGFSPGGGSIALQMGFQAAFSTWFAPQHLAEQLILAITARGVRGNTLRQGLHGSSPPPAPAARTHTTLTPVDEEWNGEGQQSLRRSSTFHPTPPPPPTAAFAR